jgi:hypothetical protein
MGKLYVPSDGLTSWQKRLADPQLHWKRGASALELAASWELGASSSRGLPDAVARVLDAHPATVGAELIAAFPEHRVPLPGGSRASQTDLWALLKVRGGTASMAVEGKAREPFGPTIDEWLQDASPEKRTRLSALCRTLGLGPIENAELRYQLFHRAASAVIEGERTGARTAVLVVQNFLPETRTWADFAAFAQLFGATACRDGVCEIPYPRPGGAAPTLDESVSRRGIDRLLLAWADCRLATDAELGSLRRHH